MSLRLPTDFKMAYLPVKKDDGVICHAVTPASLPKPALRHCKHLCCVIAHSGPTPMAALPYAIAQASPTSFPPHL